MKLTKGGKALYMHCLPADITRVSCAQGEVAKDVFERYRLATYREAGQKPFVIAAMIFLARVKDPVETLLRLSCPASSSNSTRTSSAARPGAAASGESSSPPSASCAIPPWSRRQSRPGSPRSA